MKQAISLFVIFLAITLTACASNVELGNIEDRLLEMGLELGETNSRIPRYRVNGWSSLDDENLLITVGVNDKYLIRLRSMCFNLSSAFFVGFTTPMNSVDRFSRLVIRGPGRGREFCDIEDIVRLYPVGGR
jgi:hypothetical protein